MPPTVKINREMIVKAGFELVREEGIEVISARSLADKLNCSVKPLFRVYDNMDACKADIMNEVWKFYNDFMGKRIEKDAQLLTISLAYAEIAQNERNLFHAMFLSELRGGWGIGDVLDAKWNQEAIEQTMSLYNVSKESARNIFRDTWLYTHGVAAQIFGNSIVLSNEDIKRLITNVIQCFLEGEKKMEQKDREYLDGLKGWLEETKDTKLEEMDQFFKVRVDGYEEHMSSWGDHYKWVTDTIPEDVENLLDIGCGTGLELDQVFERFPNMKVTGVDLAKSMLDQLERKHGDKNLTLICEDYFVAPFGSECFDAAVSFETLHHFKPEKKILVFKKLYDSLKSGGCYIQCDYIARTQEQEDLLFAECERRRERDNVPEGVFVHFDTPLTLEHEMELMRQAGFEKVEMVGYLEDENTPMIIATKK